MTLDGYGAEAMAGFVQAASGGKYVRCADSANRGSASFAFAGRSGRYEVRVDTAQRMQVPLAGDEDTFGGGLPAGDGEEFGAEPVEAFPRFGGEGDRASRAVGFGFALTPPYEYRLSVGWR